MDCIFCKIGVGVIPSDTVFEDDVIRVFRDIHPKAPVHLLVIPKEHVASIAHLEENHAMLIQKIIYTAKRIAKEQGLAGYKLVFNVGREGGQVIDHLHLHLLAGWPKGELDNGVLLHV
ncbi:MAG: histidine triad nucleotide-binding protein [Candidatus Wildermuthbacteria bacterium RIFCSPLOWO2_01_FULL_48_16]|uniref:Histidine triad nucleotide-binding protein n=1 Tax=Candidatus Wildermuthbacteria bacterium RIFCSPLOWO2_01_FULL_48_16 TaxID=1802461 RepID=A0A1G2RME5_9BACT|nr:MAG: histidine triad nucleotide-binding protein [Candidatus Wildermuthbacteria bacterium RIFCSPLOWO2_01_FULL_48_16]